MLIFCILETKIALFINTGKPLYKQLFGTKTTVAYIEEVAYIDK